VGVPKNPQVWNSGLLVTFLLMQLVVFREHRAEENAADLSYSSSMAEMD
jgi:hypothetical protein